VVWVFEFKVEDLVELAWIWWEESQSLIEYKKYIRDKMEYIEHKASHGDLSARLYIDIINWAYETRLTLTKTFLDLTRDLSVYEWAKVRQEFPHEKFLHPLEELQVELETLSFNIIDVVYERCHARGDRDSFISLFLRLPYRLRKRYLEPPYRRELVEAFVGSEVMEVMDKARVEVKVVVDVEDVIPLVKKYGGNWREKIREMIKEMIRREVGVGES
jgi:hypothetical protein